MFHEIGLNNFSGFYNHKKYKYVISENEFLSLIKLSKDNEEKFKFEYTFDDGGISNLKAAEILSKNDLKGIFYIPTNYINKKNFLSSDQLVHLEGMGHEIGTHTHTHPMFLNKFNFHNQEDEWTKSVDILENIISKKVIYSSCPNGFYNDDTFRILNKLKIKVLHSSIPSNTIFKKYNNIIFKGRMAIRKNSNNHMIINNNFLMNNKNLLRYNILKTLKNFYPRYWN